MDIFKHLKKNKIKVHSPTQATGTCKEPYTVIKAAGSDKLFGISTAQHHYDLMCYVPQDEYTTLEPYVDKVEKLMKELEPMIKPTNFRTPSFFDETVKAHMISTQFYNYRKL